MIVEKLTKMNDEIAEDIGSSNPALLKSDIASLTEKLTKVHSTLITLTEATKAKEELNNQLNETKSSLESIKQVCCF